MSVWFNARESVKYWGFFLNVHVLHFYYVNVEEAAVVVITFLVLNVHFFISLFLINWSKCKYMSHNGQERLALVEA